MEIIDAPNAVQSGRIRSTNHADEGAQSDRVSYDEMFSSAPKGMIIEDYPNDKPYPSCLIAGNSFKGEPVHSFWAHNKETRWAALVTIYRPDPARWINWKRRIQ